MLGSIHQVPVEPADLEELRTNMLSMPAHEDVPEGLCLLSEAGFRLMTLTVALWNVSGLLTFSNVSSASIVFAGSSLLRRHTIS